VRAGIDRAAAHVVGRARGWAEARNHDFDALESYVSFVGFPRSGHTLVGSLLTAHPDAVISHELDALRYLQERVDRRALFGLVLREDRRFAESGSVWTGYDYSVPGQWQGRYRKLKVIGDKKGGGTALRLHSRPQLLDRLSRTVLLPTKYVIVTRNPLDNITRMSTRGSMSLGQAIDVYFRMADAAERTVREAESFVMTHEAFASDPVSHLRSLVSWLELEADDQYLSACGSIVHPPRPAREEVRWDADVLTYVRREASRRSILAHYAD
jgi:hypothetical protein